MTFTTRPARPRRTLAFAGATLAITVALTGCSAAGGGEAADDRLDTVVYAYRNEVNTIDPARADYVQTNTVAQALYDPLVRFNTEGELVGVLAEDFVFSETVDSIDITLREATFHDGSPVTAEDVKYSFDRYVELGVGIAGQIGNYASTEVIDERTLRIALKQPDALFLGALTRVYIVNSKLVSEHEGSDNAQGWLLNNDAGSGAFELVEEAEGTYELSAYADYWDYDNERPESLVLRRIDEPATIRDEILAGKVDVGSVDTKDIQTLESAGASIVPDQSGTMYVFFNNSQGLSANPAVREAVRLAYDYEGGLEKLRAGQGTIADGPLPANLACRPELPSSEQNLEEARKVLDEAGLGDITLTMRFQPAFAEMAQEATLLQSNLAEIGVTLNLEPIAFADYLTMLSDWSQIPEMMLAGESAPYPDAGVMVSRLFDSKAVGTNKVAYANPEVDALIAEAAAEPDADARCELYTQAQAIIDEDRALMAMYTTSGALATRADVTGATPGKGNALLTDLRVRQ